MEDKRVKTVIIVISSLGLLSAATGFAAEVTKIKPYQNDSTSFKCVYPKNQAFPLGLTAAFALLIAQIIIICENGCAVQGRGPCNLGSPYNAMFSMLTFITGFPILFVAAVLNDYGNNMPIALLGKSYNYNCYYTRLGVFTIGTFLSIASICSSLAHYIYLNLARPAVRNGIPMIKIPVPPAQGPFSQV